MEYDIVKLKPMSLIDEYDENSDTLNDTEDPVPHKP